MAVMLRFCTIAGFVACLAILPVNGSKLNVPKLLLPYYSQFTTNFTLEASDGCFIWYDGSCFPFIAHLVALPLVKTWSSPQW